MDNAWIWTAIAAMCAVVMVQIALAKIAVNNVDRLNKAEAAAATAQSRADTAAVRADTAAVSVIAARLEIERVEKDLVEHRVESAREYVPKEALKDFKAEIVDAINRLGDRLDSLFKDSGRSHVK